MSENQKQQLERELWNIADVLRGKMDADEFRDYILGFIFYKYLSEKMQIFANATFAESNEEITYLDIDENTEEGQEYLEAMHEEATDRLGYFLKPSELFSQIAKKGNAKSENETDTFILDDLKKILKNIEASTQGTNSEEEFIDLFEDIDLNSTKLGKRVEDKNKVIAKVLAHLDNIDFQLEDADSDILGDAYEYLIGQFASNAGKKAGEFYTPQPVSKILAQLVTIGRPTIKSVYDPTCGSGSLLLRVAKETKVDMFYGQELNRTTFNLARMNMILHDVHYNQFDLKQEDTLERPQHLDKRFDAIVANPPFSAKWSASVIHETDDRFSQYGKLAPKTKADFAFVQHMIHHLNDKGTMAVVLPHGVLFRGSSEGLIRKYLIQDRNYLDAVIGLPANIFYGTSIPTCILVLKKCREKADNVLFIDASQEFEKGKNQNVLTNDHIDKIINTFHERKTIEKYSYVAPLEEIEENEYNLNIPRYVDTFEAEEPVNLEEITQKLQQVDTELTDIDSQITDFCKELGIDTPF